MTGGAAITLCNASIMYGASWGEDRNIIAAPGAGSLFRVSSAGGKIEPLGALGPGEFGHRWPQILPGGEVALLTAGLSAGDSARIEVLSLADHKQKTVQQGGYFGHYLVGPNGEGYLLYLNRGTSPLRLTSSGWRSAARQYPCRTL